MYVWPKWNQSPVDSIRHKSWQKLVNPFTASLREAWLLVSNKIRYIYHQIIFFFCGMIFFFLTHFLISYKVLHVTVSSCVHTESCCRIYVHKIWLYTQTAYWDFTWNWLWLEILCLRGSRVNVSASSHQGCLWILLENSRVSGSNQKEADPGD